MSSVDLVDSMFSVVKIAYLSGSSCPLAHRVSKGALRTCGQDAAHESPQKIKSKFLIKFPFFCGIYLTALPGQISRILQWVQAFFRLTAPL